MNDNERTPLPLELPPQSLALGISCFRDLRLDDLEAAVTAFLSEQQLPDETLFALAAPWSRKRTGALIEFAEERELVLLTYPLDKLALHRRGLAARRMAGLCESAALLAAGVRELAVPKRVYGRLALAGAIRRTSGGV